MAKRWIACIYMRNMATFSKNVFLLTELVTEIIEKHSTFRYHLQIIYRAKRFLARFDC